MIVIIKIIIHFISIKNGIKRNLEEDIDFVFLKNKRVVNFNVNEVENSYLVDIKTIDDDVYNGVIKVIRKVIYYQNREDLVKENVMENIVGIIQEEEIDFVPTQLKGIKVKIIISLEDYLVDKDYEQDLINIHILRIRKKSKPVVGISGVQKVKKEI